MVDNALSVEQQHSLFHFLCHTEAFVEFTSLKIPGRIAAYGPPFLPNPKYENEQCSPILEKCTRHFVLTDTLPAFCKVKDDSAFWGGKVQKLLETMAESTLSDSYDKGKVSKRKILGMACSVFLANIARGLFGKVAADQDAPVTGTASKDYRSGAELIEAWRKWKIGMIYESNLPDILQLLEDGVPERDWPAHQHAAYLYVKLTLASLLHYILVSSPDGDDTLNLLSRLHSKLPYWSMRQALKIPYATSMVQGMIKLFLAKPMFGGKALIQQLISGILGQDQTRCEKGIAALEKENKIATELVQSVKQYVYDTGREQQCEIREKSMKQEVSIIAAITGRTDISEEEHKRALEYLELQLSRRDRVELIRILTGDETLTTLIRAGLDVFFPIIEELHRAVNLPEGLGDLQNFLNDLVAVSEKRGSINDFADLITDHQGSFDKFARQILRKSPEMKKGYTIWYKHCLEAYMGTPAMNLQDSLKTVEAETRNAILNELKQYQEYINQKKQDSEHNLDLILKGSGKDGFGDWLGILHDVQNDARVTPRTVKMKAVPAIRPDMTQTQSAMLDIFRQGLMVRTPEHDEAQKLVK